jgi:ParB-like chromosome segregation protein Spo0J
LFGRAGAERQASLEESVKSEGIKEPISVDRMSQRVTDGHHRVVAALKSGQPIKFQDPNNPYRSSSTSPTK